MREVEPSTQFLTSAIRDIARFTGGPVQIAGVNWDTTSDEDPAYGSMRTSGAG
jgi:hypothetical protein